MKAGGFALGDDTRVDADWDLFGRVINPQFNSIQDPALSEAVTYLLGRPPKKQVLIDDRLDWRDAPPDPNLSRAHRVLLAVRRVRNNLFHGGKFLAPDEPGDDRDRLLVQHSLTRSARMHTPKPSGLGRL
ncbi:MAG TPA: hypothetical protein VNJ70_19190 [Thermoanaerobaculia bacterium]|nr:hypothetical protein [Thermoanaerobaculia bacterium]